MLATITVEDGAKNTDQETHQLATCRYGDAPCSNYGIFWDHDAGEQTGGL